MFDTLYIRESPTPVYKNTNLLDSLTEKEMIRIIQLGQAAQKLIQEDNLTADLTIDDNTILTYVGAGEYSITYKLILDNKTFLLKLRNLLFDKRSINYIKEMAIMLKLKRDLEQGMTELGVNLPDYYFATVDIVCREYVEGQNINVNLNDEKILDIEILIQKWLEKSGKTNIQTDFRDRMGRPVIKNFIQSGDQIFLIDPFINEE